VDSVDTMVSEKLHQSPHASWVNRTLETEYLWRKAAAPKQIPEPANSMRWTDGNDRVTALP
jgi:hypothetical protein